MDARKLERLGSGSLVEVAKALADSRSQVDVRVLCVSEGFREKLIRIRIVRCNKTHARVDSLHRDHTIGQGSVKESKYRPNKENKLAGTCNNVVWFLKRFSIEEREKGARSARAR